MWNEVNYLCYSGGTATSSHNVHSLAISLSTRVNLGEHVSSDEVSSSETFPFVQRYLPNIQWKFLWQAHIEWCDVGKKTLLGHRINAHLYVHMCFVCGANVPSINMSVCSFAESGLLSKLPIVFNWGNFLKIYLFELMDGVSLPHTIKKHSEGTAVQSAQWRSQRKRAISTNWKSHLIVSHAI